MYSVHTRAAGPAGSLPLTEEMLRNWSSGDLFGLSQDAGMGWNLPRWDAKSSSFFPHREDFGRMMARRLRWDITRDIGKWDC